MWLHNDPFPGDCQLVPLVIVHAAGVIVLQLDPAPARAQHQVDMALHQLQRQEVCLLARVEHDEPAGLGGAQPQVDVEVVEGPQLGQPEVGGVGGEGDAITFLLQWIVVENSKCPERHFHN